MTEPKKTESAEPLKGSAPTPEFQEPRILTPEERALRYEELRRRQLNSRIFAEARNPAIAVRWVRKDDPNDIALHEWWGFIIAKEPNPKAPKDKRRFHTAIPPREDGTYICGDVILMEIAKDDYDFYLNQNRATANEMIPQGQRAFREEAAKLDVVTYARDKSGTKIG